MRRQTSSSLRVLRTVVALMTVWCTGCAGFDAIVQAAIGTAPGMACASEASVATAQQSVPAVQPMPTAADEGFTCGCTSCHAVTLSTPALAPTPSLALGPAAMPASAMPSVSPVPLLPPPEHTS